MTRYEVPGMKLIPQTKEWSCWYASARMLIQWQMNRCQMSFSDLVPPELDAQCRRIRDANKGIVNSAIVQMARRLGLRQEPPMSHTIESLERMLRSHGPLWVNGDRHIVVIAGLDGDHVKVYDPAPLGKGQVEWRSLSKWLYREIAGNYTIQRGDTLSKIGQSHGVSWRVIYGHRQNAAFRKKRPNPNLIYPGDVIYIPTSASDMDTGAPLTFLYLPARRCAMIK